MQWSSGKQSDHPAGTKVHMAFYSRKLNTYCDMSFNNFVVSVCSRTCNQVEDCLAAYGALWRGLIRVLFMEDVPDFVSHLVSGDMPRDYV